jgi:glycosyltransferase involved in cell wall biosynthesis
MTAPMLRGARIAYLIETDGPGGAERMVAHLASAFAEAGCTCVAVVPANGEGWLGGELRGTSVAVEEVRLDGRASLRCVRDLENLFRKRRIDLVHSHEFTMSVYGAWAARRVRVPHLITMHGGRYYASGVHRRLALRAAVHASGGAVAVSAHVARQLCRDLRLAERFVTVIPNGVAAAPEISGTLRAELGLAPGDSLIVAVGNLYPVKGHAWLVEALAGITQVVPRAHLAIAGRGELHDALAGQAGRLGLAARVHLLGFRSDIQNVLASADVFVLPSLSEGLPLALLEAMSRGLPVVATDVGEVAAVLGADSGLVVPPGNAASLAMALQRLLTDRPAAERFGRAARRRVASDFGLRQMVERYSELYAHHLTAADDG